MRYHLYQKFFGKVVKIKEMSFLSTRGMGLMFGNCSYGFPLTSLTLNFFFRDAKHCDLETVILSSKLDSRHPWQSDSECSKYLIRYVTYWSNERGSSKVGFAKL